MPFYQYENTKTGEIEEHMLKIDQRDQFVIDNPHLKRVISAPGYADSVRMFGNRDQGFKEVLQKVKQHHPYGEWGGKNV